MNEGKINTPPQKDNKTKLIEIVSTDGEIILRQFSPADAKEIFELIDSSRDHLSQFGEDTAQKYPTYESVLDSIVSQPNPNRMRLAIRNKEGVFAGSINLTPDEDNPKRGEIGYYLGEKFIGKGYATRALQAITDFAFAKLGYNTLYGNVGERNNASIAVLKRVGYLETERRNDRIEFSRNKE